MDSFRQSDQNVSFVIMIISWERHWKITLKWLWELTFWPFKHLFLIDLSSFFLRWAQLYFVVWWLVSVVICINLFVALVTEVSVQFANHGLVWYSLSSTQSCHYTHFWAYVIFHMAWVILKNFNPPPPA